LDVKPGERVALIAPNVPALVIGLFAIWQAGAVAVPLSARLRRFELQRAFADAEPSALVSVGSQRGFQLEDEVKVLSERTPTLATCLTLDELGHVVDEARPKAGARAEPLSSEVAAIMYTSGTTGEPKGALMSHALGEAEARQLAELLGASADAACGLVVPASHAFGLACLLGSIAGGGVAVLVDSTISLRPLVEAMRLHGGRVLHGTPALFARLLRGGVELPVRTGFTAGSACPPEVLAELDQRGARILNVYGMTEIGAATACRPDDAPEVRYRTVGRALPGYEFRVVAQGGAPSQSPGEPLPAPGEPLPASERPGEIQVRGPFVSPGYHRRAWTSEETAGDGWFRTGDLGSLDAAGNLVVAGRAKEVVHVGGFNVFPAEVENFLLTHPDIAQAAVIGVPHQTMGESLEAFVVLTPGAKLESGDVVRFAREGIAGYKVPYAVRVLDKLPLLPSGKPDRRALARDAERKRAVA
jgi:long-chain acyl-CoA synthetase